MQVLLDSPPATHEVRTHARDDCAASPEPPPAVTPMTRGVDMVVRRSNVADAQHGSEGMKASPAPPAADVSPKVSSIPDFAVKPDQLTLGRCVCTIACGIY